MTNEYVIVNSKTNTADVWNTIASKYTPSKGEVCVIVPSKGNLDEANNINDESLKSTKVAIKIGNGLDVFRDLPYLTDASNIRPDWEETDTTSPNYIWHKPIVDTDMIVSGEIKNLKIGDEQLRNASTRSTVKFPDQVGEEYYELMQLNNIDNFTNPLSLLILEDNNWGYYDYSFGADGNITEKEIKYFYRNNISKKNKFVAVDINAGERYTLIYPIFYSVLETEIFEKNIKNLVLLRFDPNPGYEIRNDQNETTSSINWNDIMGENSGWSFLSPKNDYLSGVKALFYYDNENRIYYRTNNDLKIYNYSSNIPNDYEESEKENGIKAYNFFISFTRSLLQGACDALTQEALKINGIIELKTIYEILNKTFFESISSIANPNEEDILSIEDYEMLREISEKVQKNLLSWEVLSQIQDNTRDAYQNYYEINDEVVIDSNTSKLYLKKSKLDSLLNNSLRLPSYSCEVKAGENIFEIPVGYSINNYSARKVAEEVNPSQDSVLIEGNGEIVKIQTEKEIEFTRSQILQYNREANNNIQLRNNTLEKDGEYYKKPISNNNFFTFNSDIIIPQDAEISIIYKKPSDIELFEFGNNGEKNLKTWINIQDFPKNYWEYSTIVLSYNVGDNVANTTLNYGKHFILSESSNREEFTIVFFKEANIYLDNYESAKLHCENDLVFLVENAKINNKSIKIDKVLLHNDFKIQYNIKGKTLYAYFIPPTEKLTLRFSEGNSEAETISNITTALRSYLAQQNGNNALINGKYYKITKAPIAQSLDMPLKKYLLKVVGDKLIKLNTLDNYYYEIKQSTQTETGWEYEIIFNFNCYNGDSINLINSFDSSSNNTFILEVINQNDNNQIIQLSSPLQDNYIFTFTRSNRLINELEMNFYYRTQQLRSDLVAGFKPDWSVNDETIESFIYNRPFYLDDNGNLYMETKFQEQLDEHIRSIHNEMKDRSSLIEQALNNIKNENAMIQRELNDYRSIEKIPTNPESGILESSDIKGILPVVKQLVNEVRFLYNLINSKTEVRIQNTEPEDGKLWINTDENSGNGILYYKESNNTPWKPLSAPWTNAYSS